MRRPSSRPPLTSSACHFAQDSGFFDCVPGSRYYGFNSTGGIDENNYVDCPAGASLPKLYASAKCNQRHPLHLDCCHSTEGNDDSCVAESINASLAHVWMAALCSGCEHESTGANDGCDMTDDDWITSDEVLAQPQNFRPDCRDESADTCAEIPAGSSYSHQCATSDGCVAANFSVYAGRPHPRPAARCKSTPVTNAPLTPIIHTSFPLPPPSPSPLHGPPITPA